MTQTSWRCAVVGSGLMGAAIGQVLAAAGHEVAFYDPSEAVRTGLRERLGSIFTLLGQDPRTGMAGVTLHGDLGSAVDGARFVVEAAPEKLPVKQAIFRELDRLAGRAAILASNTSGIPVHEIAAPVADPSRVVGTHFWNPPYLVPLVEVVQSARTADAVVGETVHLLASAGLKPVHLRADIPGFVGNRLQHAMKREAIALVAQGVCDPETIDTVVKYGFGLRLPYLGPLEQSDLVGLGLTLDVHDVLMPVLDTTQQPHPLLVAKVRAGQLGAASGRGFRSWAPGEADATRERVTAGLLEAARRRRLEEAAPGANGGPAAPASRAGPAAARGC